MFHAHDASSSPVATAARPLCAQSHWWSIVRKRDFVLNRQVTREMLEGKVWTFSSSDGRGTVFSSARLFFQHDSRLTLPTRYKHVRQMCFITWPEQTLAIEEGAWSFEWWAEPFNCKELQDLRWNLLCLALESSRLSPCCGLSCNLQHTADAKEVGGSETSGLILGMSGGHLHLLEVARNERWFVPQLPPVSLAKPS